MMARGFERLCFSRGVLYPAAGAQIRNAFRKNPRWGLSKLSAKVAANAGMSVRTTPFPAEKGIIGSIIPDARLVAVARRNAITARWSDMAMS